MSELKISPELLQISPEVQDALKNKKPVVALESTIISHGMPFPQNAQTAIEVEETIRKQGAVPATIAIIGGVMKVGLSKEEIELLGREGHNVTKVSRRDLPFVVAAGKNGATTVASTMIIAALAGIKVFATGGIGGVHRGAEHTFDISADLQELANTNVTVVCAGAKSILDLGLTTEYLETFGFLTRGAQAAGFRHAGECDVSDQLQRVRRAILNTGRTVFAPRTKVAFMRRGFYFSCRDGCQDDLHRTKRTGHHAGFTANTLLLIDLNAVINVADCAIRAATGAGRIFTMVTGHCTTLLLMFDNRNSGMKMVLAQDMLLIIVSHDTGDFTSMTTQTLC